MKSLFYRNQHLLFISIIAILLAGGYAYVKIPRLEDPRITNRNPIIITRMPGASATRVESLITEKIEDSLRDISEIKKVESVSRTGGSLIAIELQDWVDGNSNEEIFSKIRDKLREVGNKLPESASKPEFDDKRMGVAYTMIIAVRWNREGAVDYNALNRVAEELADRLRVMNSTELVRSYGTPKEEISVLLDQEETTLMGLDAMGVSHAIAASDSKVPAGVFRSEEVDLLLEVKGELSSVERIGRIPLITNDRGLVTRVFDIAAVSKDWKRPLEEVALVDGKEAVLVCARMDKNFNVNDWKREAESIVEEIANNRGDNIIVKKIFDQSVYTNERLAELGGNLVAGAIVVTFIVFFTMGIRAALVVGFALPLTASCTLFWLYITGEALHQIAIYGMIVSLGLLIDNAIVVVDDIRKDLEKGDTPLEALEDTFSHLLIPLSSSTMTTVLGFMPIMLMQGNVGDFVKAIGGSVVTSIVASFALSLTIIASLAVSFIDYGPSEKKLHWWNRGFSSKRLSKQTEKTLTYLFNNPYLAVIISLALPLFGFAIAPTLGNEFFPPTDRNMFDIKVWLPSGSPIEKTRAVVERMNKMMNDYSEILEVNWMIGNNFPIVYYNQLMINDFTSSYAQASVKTKTNEDAHRLSVELQNLFDKEIITAQTVVKKFAQGPPKQADVEYRIIGPNVAAMQDIGDKLRLLLQNNSDVLITSMSLERGTPKLWFDVDEVEAARVGISLSSISHQLATNLEGVTGGTVIEDLDELDVRVRYGKSIRNSLRSIESMNLTIPTSPKKWIPLSTLGSTSLEPETAIITRFNSQRCNTVRAVTVDGALPIDIAYSTYEKFIKGKGNLPEGYSIELGADVELDRQSIDQLKQYIIPILFAIMSTLILSFQSVRLAILLGSVSIFSIGLGLFSTWLISFPISFNTILGTLGLIGVAINDSIVVLASIVADEKASRGDISALVNRVMDAMRHVLSTTFTTIGGFLPILIFVGGEFWPSLAIVMVGGVAGATLMGILLIPAGYLLMHFRNGVAS